MERQKKQKRWRDLTERQRTAILVLASVELSLTATAAVDLWRAPAELVRGDRRLWWPVLLVQPFGPLLYLLLGRRRTGGKT
ncbi:hypothetical protein [Streptosporangium saharense]|uniref:hypothetical protein n=1 Tax=Streptosporangium saharense TaxID=1706840 RepID=UPI0033248B37